MNAPKVETRSTAAIIFINESKILYFPKIKIKVQNPNSNPGVNNFAKLPVLTVGVQSLAGFTSIENKNIQLEDHITILCYWGNDLSLKQAEAFNLNEKIYKRFAEFEDFQFHQNHGKLMRK